MNILRVRKSDRVLKGTIRLPSSKSISNRLLIIRELTDGDFRINNLSGSEDTLLLEKLLSTIRTARNEHGLIELDTANAGTAMRFLTAYLAMTPGKWVLTGSARMKQRPIGILVDALKPLGASIEYLGTLGFPPLLIKGGGLRGREIVVDPGISSQFVSALLMIAPKLPGGLVLHMSGQPVSFPYVNMTIRLMAGFGIRIASDHRYLKVPESIYIPDEVTVEGDWSAAAFWYEAAAMAEDVDLVLEGLIKESIQGDAILAKLFTCFGVKTEFLGSGIRLTKSGVKKEGCTFNFADFPDIAPAVITTCAVLGLPGKFEGLKSLKIKETDRIRALSNEYMKLGIFMDPDPANDSHSEIEFVPANVEIQSGVRINTYDDHRMAMTFAPLAIRSGEVLIESPEVVRKSYPGFWDDMRALGFDLS